MPRGRLFMVCDFMSRFHKGRVNFLKAGPKRYKENVSIFVVVTPNVYLMLMDNTARQLGPCKKLPSNVPTCSTCKFTIASGPTCVALVVVQVPDATRQLGRCGNLPSTTSAWSCLNLPGWVKTG